MLKTEALKIAQLEAVDITVDGGHCAGLAGESGSGKTRLLRAIADLDEHGGRVYADDIEQQSLPAHEWRRRVCMLPAESAWWLDRVGQHFRTQDNAAVNEQTLAALGFDSGVLQWPVSRLSSGEKQRLAVLRTLQISPRVLLLDEPTANLDRRNSDTVERMIADYIRTSRACAIWVSHDREQLARVASHCYGVVDARVEVLQ